MTMNSSEAMGMFSGAFNRPKKEFMTMTDTESSTAIAGDQRAEVAAALRSIMGITPHERIAWIEHLLATTGATVDELGIYLRFIARGKPERASPKQ